jgi:hypothetical protein
MTDAVEKVRGIRLERDNRIIGIDFQKSFFDDIDPRPTSIDDQTLHTSQGDSSMHLPCERFTSALAGRRASLGVGMVG